MTWRSSSGTATRPSILGEAAVLNADISMRVFVPDQHSPEIVETEFPARHSIVGFAALFRHFYANGERASFNQVQRILRRANLALDDEGDVLRAAALQAWAGAQGRLRGYTLHALAKAAYTGQPIREELSKYSPEFIISVFNYGDDLHWDQRHRDMTRAWTKDEFMTAHMRMTFLESTACLAHLYIEFACLASRAAER
jgi:hypothetical protein